jgi:hypothetical protein
MSKIEPDTSPVMFITLTNTGYIDYTLNCLQSLKKCGFAGTLHCHCIGAEGNRRLLSEGYSTSLIDNEEHSNFQEFRKGNWHNITSKKFEIIFKYLINNKYVCITDGDIVFENRNFMKYCLNHIGDNDLLIQNDRQFDDDDSNLCSGFMFIQSNPTTIAFFDPIQAHIPRRSGDQTYINDNITKLKYKKLPLELFPNGKYYYKHKSTNKELLIHFNWTIGHDKKRKMKHHNKWLISN